MQGCSGARDCAICSGDVDTPTYGNRQLLLPHVGLWTGERVSHQHLRLCGYTWNVGIIGKPAHLEICLRCWSEPAEPVSVQWSIFNHTDHTKTVNTATSTQIQDSGQYDFNIPFGKLLSSRLGFVKEGFLYLGLQARLSTGIANGMQPAEGHAEHPSKCLADFCNNAEFSDITLKAQGTIIHAHKVVLAAHSPYFKTMLQPGGSFQESDATEIELTGVDEPVLQLLVSYIYGKLGKVPDDLLLPLFLAADQHQMEGLRQCCQHQLLTEITSNTVLKLADVADALDDKSMKGAVLKFWAEDSHSVKTASEPAMMQLMQDKPALAQELIVTLLNKPRKHKRKATEINIM